jgi:hypothetical protein
MFVFNCARCGRELCSTEEQEAAARLEAIDRYGHDIDPAQCARVCEDCDRVIRVMLSEDDPDMFPRAFKNSCPGCNMPANPYRPRPGGFIVCQECGAVAIITAEMALRLADRADLLYLSGNNPENFNLLVSIAIGTQKRIARENQKCKWNVN